MGLKTKSHTHHYYSEEQPDRMFTTIRVPPTLQDFIPLAEYESQTPETFFGGKPILYYHGVDVKAWLHIVEEDSMPLPIFPADATDTAPTDQSGASLNGSAPDVKEQKVEVFVNSEYGSSLTLCRATLSLTPGRTLTVFNAKAEAGMQIPYPYISIHALKDVASGERKVKAVWMQIDLPTQEDDESLDPLELTLIPAPAEAEATDGDLLGEARSSAQQLFDAIAACSDLHPDAADEDEDEEDDRIFFEDGVGGDALDGFPGVVIGSADGDLPPPMPGSSGWITAENVDQYFDADGNWLRGSQGAEEELGGAGRVRGREEIDTDANGNDSNQDSDAKRPRVE